MHGVLAALFLTAGAGAAGVMAFQERVPEAPAQPIRFSHRVHAGEAAIGCASCHAYADRGPVAGIPSMARCRGCHKFVKRDAESPAITKELEVLTRKLEENAVIEWVRVHRLPDHVFFTHKRHVSSGVACRECHGDIERMDVVRQVASLSMGWCLECHRRKQEERPLERAGLTDCSTCHK